MTLGSFFNKIKKNNSINGGEILIRRNDITFFHITPTEGTSTSSLNLVKSHIFKGSLQCGKDGDHMNLGVG